MAEKSSKPTLVAADVLKGSIDDVKAVLGDARAADLKALAEAETAEGAENRKGVKEAIEAEQAARTDLAKEQISAAVEAADHAGMELHVFTSRDQFEEPGEAKRLSLRVSELETALAAAAEADKAAAPKAKKPKKQRKLEVSDKALPIIDTLAFVGRDGRTLADLPDLPVQQRQLKRERGGMTFMGEIVFPETAGRSTDLCAIVALDANGKAISECKMIAPFPVGGAGEATFAPGFLHFANWPKAEG